MENIHTNIVYFDIQSEQITAASLIEKLADRSIKILNLGPARLRAVTHYGITTDDIDVTLDALQKIMKKR